MSSVVAIADMFGIAGRQGELVAALAGEQDAASGAEGCLRYSFSAALDEPDHFVLVSEWRDRRALDAHYASSGFQAFQRSLQGLLARPSEMKIYAVAETARPVASGPMDPRDAD
jgi:quinol monooxygenase YgiN